VVFAGGEEGAGFAAYHHMPAPIRMIIIIPIMTLVVDCPFIPIAYSFWE
jgi:hypothetical protein